MYVQHRETKNWCLHFSVVSTLNKVFFGVDGQVMSGWLANMAVDSSVAASLSEAWNLLMSLWETVFKFCSLVLSNKQPGVMVPSLWHFPLLCCLSLKGTIPDRDKRMSRWRHFCCVSSDKPAHYLLCNSSQFVPVWRSLRGGSAQRQRDRSASAFSGAAEQSGRLTLQAALQWCFGVEKLCIGISQLRSRTSKCISSTEHGRPSRSNSTVSWTNN